MSTVFHKTEGENNTLKMLTSTLPRYSYNIIESGVNHIKHQPIFNTVCTCMNLVRIQATSVIYFDFVERINVSFNID